MRKIRAKSSAKSMANSIRSGLQPKPHLMLAKVLSTSSAISGQVQFATVQIADVTGYSSDISVRVPPGMSIYQGQVVSLENIGSPSLAEWVFKEGIHGSGGGDNVVATHSHAEYSDRKKVDAVVDVDGYGTHTTLASAILDHPGGGTNYHIYVAPGSYTGGVTLPDNTTLELAAGATISSSGGGVCIDTSGRTITIIGHGEKSIITSDSSIATINLSKSGTGGLAVVKDLRVESTYDPGGAPATFPASVYNLVAVIRNYLGPPTRVENCTVVTTTGKASGVTLFPSDGLDSDLYDDLGWIVGNRFISVVGSDRGNEATAIQVEVSANTDYGSVISNNFIGGNWYGAGITVWGGGHRIIANKIERIQGTGIFCWGATDTIVSYNEISTITYSGYPIPSPIPYGDAGQPDRYGIGILIRSNNYGGLRIFKNEIVGTEGPGILLQQNKNGNRGATPVVIENNYLWAISSDGIQVMFPSDGMWIEGNFIDSAGGYYSDTFVCAGINIFRGTHSSYHNVTGGSYDEANIYGPARIARNVITNYDDYDYEGDGGYQIHGILLNPLYHATLGQAKIVELQIEGNHIQGMYGDGINLQGKIDGGRIVDNIIERCSHNGITTDESSEEMRRVFISGNRIANMSELAIHLGSASTENKTWINDIQWNALGGYQDDGTMNEFWNPPLQWTANVEVEETVSVSDSATVDAGALSASASDSISVSDEPNVSIP